MKVPQNKIPFLNFKMNIFPLFKFIMEWESDFSLLRENKTTRQKKTEEDNGME